MNGEIVGRKGRFSVRLVQDSEPTNPCAEWDQAGTMVCWHNRYDLGHTGGRRHKGAEYSKEYAGMFPTPNDFEEWWADNDIGGIRIGLCLYDHSGITMSCAPLSCPWDSGQVGWIFATRITVYKEWNGDLAMAERCLRAEVENYDQYLTGDVWGYVLAEHKDEGKDSEMIDDHLDSCWGFFGSEYAKTEALSVLNSYADNVAANGEHVMI